jgi:hypothetical protein
VGLMSGYAVEISNYYTELLSKTLEALFKEDEKCLKNSKVERTRIYTCMAAWESTVCSVLSRPSL